MILIFGAFGGFGLVLQALAIADARKHRDALHFRSLPLRELPTGRALVVRLRKYGVGDVLLDSDGFWDSGSDSPNSGNYASVEVGFLLVPDAKNVADRVRHAQKD